MVTWRGETCECRDGHFVDAEEDTVGRFEAEVGSFHSHGARDPPLDVVEGWLVIDVGPQVELELSDATQARGAGRFRDGGRVVR